MFQVPQAVAQIKWVDQSGGGWWNTPPNWSPARVPRTADDVYLTQSGAVNETVWYYNLSSGILLESLTIDSTGPGTITLWQGYGGYNQSLSADNEYIGYNGTGTFTQTGGSNEVNWLYLGLNPGSSGSYNLSAGGLLVKQGEYIGYNGTGTFTQTGGSSSVNGNLCVSGTYNLSGLGQLGVLDDEYIGLDNKTGTFTQTGGSNTAMDLKVGFSGTPGTYNLSAGQLFVEADGYIGKSGTGTYNLSGLGTLVVGVDEYIGFNGGTGTFTQTGAGGTNSVGGEYIGYGGTGTFTQTAGTNTVMGNLWVGYNPSGTGSYSLSGTGLLSVRGNEYIGYGGGTGTFTQTGGTNTVTGTLYVGNVANPPGTAGASYTLSGGTISAGSIQVNGGTTFSGCGTISTSGGFVNSGAVTFTGGPATVNSDFTNQAGGNVQITSSPAVLTGNFTNNGTVTLTNSNVTFVGTYSENGAYISSLGTTYMKGDALISPTGYWQGGAGDTWSISGNFTNQSTQNTSWSTALSTISLTGPNNHLFYVAGADKGASLAGYTNNFAWGTLSIGGGSLVLSASGTSGYAQYVTTILGLALSSGGVTNVSESAGSSLNIYYLASAPGNAYLNDAIYNLSGGGELIPVNSAVPLPPAVLLLAPALTGLGCLRRRLRSRQMTGHGVTH